MIKLTTLLLSCSLALAGAAMAQQQDPEASPAQKQAPAKGGRGKGAGQAKPGGAKPQENAPGNAQAPAADREAPQSRPQPPAAAKEQAPQTQPQAPAAADVPKGRGRGGKGHAGPKAAAPALNAPAPATAPDATGSTTKDANAAGTPAAAANTPAAGKGQRGKGMKANGKAAATATPAAAASAAPAATAAPTAAATPATVPSATAAPTAAVTATAAAVTAPTPQPAPKGAALKKPEPQVIQQIRQQHVDFRAQPRPDRVPPVTFRQDYRVQGADRWQGQQYDVYRSYRPERHDRNWYQSRYQRVELVGGGYYYWNNGYWYPAWGYSPQEEYYAYDAPIYVGQRAEPPDRIIADVQATLQQMGYYKGEVDGLLGPLTREALVGYQSDQGLTATAVMDQPTLDSLGMG